VDPADDRVCDSWPDVPVPPLVSPGGTFDPEYLLIQLGRGSWDGAGLRDYTADPDLDGVREPYSTTLTFELMDASLAALCSVVYDLSGATPAAAAWTSPGALLFHAFDLSLANGTTDCPALDPDRYAAYGTTDIRDVIETAPWGVAFGELSDDAEYDLSYLVTSDGQDWTNDWEPYTFGWYVSLDGATAVEVGYAQLRVNTCEDWFDTAPMLPKPTGAPMSPGAISPAALYYFSWPYLWGV
jgi:hypothetical protein